MPNMAMERGTEPRNQSGRAKRGIYRISRKIEHDPAVTVFAQMHFVTYCHEVPCLSADLVHRLSASIRHRDLPLQSDIL